MARNTFGGSLIEPDWHAGSAPLSSRYSGSIRDPNAPGVSIPAGAMPVNIAAALGHRQPLHAQPHPFVAEMQRVAALRRVLEIMFGHARL